MCIRDSSSPTLLSRPPPRESQPAPTPPPDGLASTPRSRRHFPHVTEANEALYARVDDITRIWVKLRENDGSYGHKPPAALQAKVEAELQSKLLELLRQWMDVFLDFDLWNTFDLREYDTDKVEERKTARRWTCAGDGREVLKQLLGFDIPEIDAVFRRASSMDEPMCCCPLYVANELVSAHGQIKHIGVPKVAAAAAAVKAGRDCRCGDLATALCWLLIMSYLPPSHVGRPALNGLFAVSGSNVERDENPHRRRLFPEYHKAITVRPCRATFVKLASGEDVPFKLRHTHCDIFLDCLCPPSGSDRPTLAQRFPSPPGSVGAVGSNAGAGAGAGAGGECAVQVPDNGNDDGFDFHDHDDGGCEVSEARPPDRELEDSDSETDTHSTDSELEEEIPGDPPMSTRTAASPPGFSETSTTWEPRRPRLSRRERRNRDWDEKRESVASACTLSMSCCGVGGCLCVTLMFAPVSCRSSVSFNSAHGAHFTHFIPSCFLHVELKVKCSNLGLVHCRVCQRYLCHACDSLWHGGKTTSGTDHWRFLSDRHALRLHRVPPRGAYGPHWVVGGRGGDPTTGPAVRDCGAGLPARSQPPDVLSP